ncbi:MAG TPA: hypothetical protein VL485_13965 [Ktedonobacteraceae bacterium]|jgi:hypothetical protein|nr:hypothetical protein [Ktedonobacteraceae bacterium]
MHEKYEEQKGWLSRIERERRNLSASVEAALFDRKSQRHSGRSESHGQTGFSETTGGTALIPPRLSLQSRVLSAVHPGGFVESATNTHQAISADTAAGMQRPFTDEQRVQQMANLAQTLTSGFAYYGYDPTLATTHPMPPVPGAVRSSSPATKSSYRPLPNLEVPSLSGYGTVPAPFPTIAPSRLPPSQVTARQRLAGRSTRVRLEVPSSEQIATRFLDHRLEPLGNERRDAGLQNRELAQETPSLTSAHLPALDLFHKGLTGTTSARMPVIDIVKGQLEASRRGLSGTGTFESGQCDLIVTNKHVTATSVIQVMLTGNPGPVVVHYISLQPRIGFTVHLTAPTNARTPFNYVILPGEQP